MEIIFKITIFICLIYN